MKYEVHEKNNKRKVAFVDIDETICFYREARIYEEAYPNHCNIEVINHLYHTGWKVVYWTSRGSSKPRDKKRLSSLRRLTKRQLKDWGAKHHSLIMGDKKPLFDLVVDDRAKRINELGGL